MPACGECGVQVESGQQACAGCIKKKKEEEERRAYHVFQPSPGKREQLQKQHRTDDERVEQYQRAKTPNAFTGGEGVLGGRPVVGEDVDLKQRRANLLENKAREDKRQKDAARQREADKKKQIEDAKVEAHKAAQREKAEKNQRRLQQESEQVQRDARAHWAGPRVGDGERQAAGGGEAREDAAEALFLQREEALVAAALKASQLSFQEEQEQKAELEEALRLSMETGMAPPLPHAPQQDVGAPEETQEEVRGERDNRDNAGERAACYVALENALKQDGQPCLVRGEFVREWTRDFSEERRIGKGAYGEVFEGVLADMPRGVGGGVVHLGTVAVKRLCNNMLTEGGEGHFKREVNVLSRFKHPNIIRLLGYTSKDADDDILCLVYEMGHRGSLSATLQEDGLARGLTWRLRVRIAHGVSMALNYLHCTDGEPVFHRDVKSANIVLSADLRPKLIDCGLARYKGGPRAAGTVGTTLGGGVLGTPGYMCPHYLRDMQFDRKSEVFSLGVVLLEIASGRVQGAGGVFLEDLLRDGDLSEADGRVGEWPNACFERFLELAKGCVARKDRRISSMLAVMREANDIVEAFCKPTEEELLQQRELARMQQESDRGKADAVLLERLKGELEAHSAALSAHRRDQREAAELARRQERERMQRRKVCLVCTDEFGAEEGAVCPAGAQHFMCAPCFSREIVAQTQPDQVAFFKRAGLRIRCRPCAGGDGPPVESFFQVGDLTRHLSEEAFCAMMRAREDVVAGRVLQEQNDRYQAQIARLEEELAAQGHAAAQVMRHRREIVENILTLKCPRCKTAFVDFDGCFALSCSQCGCGFCAYCLSDCGNSAAAHEHVRACPNSLNRGDYYGSFVLFERAQQLRRRGLVQTYLRDKVPQRERNSVLEAIAQDLGEIGIDAAQFRA